VRRWLSGDALKPWQYQSWIFITDPDFTAKAHRVLDLYDRTWNGKPLGDNDYVISADEKTSIQARCRCHPTLAAGKSRQLRANHTYARRGAVAYLAAYDVGRGRVFGRCEDTTGIEAFERLVTQVTDQEPYSSARRVFWIVDNGSSHRGQAAIDRLAARHSNAIVVHTPIHASWLKPGRDRLLYHPAKGALAQRPNRPQPRGRTPGRLRDPLQPGSQTVQMEIHHHHRPPRPPDQARRPPTRAAPQHHSTTDSLTPDEPTGETTKAPRPCFHRRDPYRR
jgi:DDE superfamily endonuclease